MVINTNMRAIEAYRDSKIQDDKLRKAQEKLSSGIRINHAADDVAGMAITSKMQAQARGLDRAELNIGDGVSMLTVADGACETLSDMVNRIRELTVKAANDTNENEDREHIQREINLLLDAMDTTVRNIRYNGRPICGPLDPNAEFSPEPGAGILSGEPPEALYSSYLIDGEYLWLQTGANSLHGEKVAIQDLRIQRLFPGDPVNVSPDITLEFIQENRVRVTEGPAPKTGNAVANCEMTLRACDTALLIINGARSNYGAWVNSLWAMESYNRIGSLNTKTAMSRINDADMAKEIMNQSKSMVMMNTSIAMLHQANQSSNRVLSLLA